MCFACLMKLYVSGSIFAVGFLTICVLLFTVMNVKVQYSVVSPKTIYSTKGKK